MASIPEIPNSKSLAVIFLGIILYLGSSYLNILAPNSSDIGEYFGLVLIVIGIFAQCINWGLYFNNKIKNQTSLNNRKIKDGLYRISLAISILGTVMLVTTIIYEDYFSKQYDSCVSNAVKELQDIVKELQDTGSSDTSVDYPIEDCQYSPSLHVDEWHTWFLRSLILVASGTTLGAIANIIPEKRSNGIISDMIKFLKNLKIKRGLFGLSLIMLVFGNPFTLNAIFHKDFFGTMYPTIGEWYEPFWLGIAFIITSAILSVSASLLSEPDKS